MADDQFPPDRTLVERPDEGFREHEHTADWELEVWASDLSNLLKQAALGMYALAGLRLSSEPRIERRLQLSAPDAESLLVGFLQELLFISEIDGVGFDQFEIRLVDLTLDAMLVGTSISSISKEIKAVTYHNLQIRNTARGLEARVVFDV
jgi:SHS2 domain-containing protein